MTKNRDTLYSKNTKTDLSACKREDKNEEKRRLSAPDLLASGGS